MVDGYFKREVTKRGVKKGAGRPLTYSTGIDEQMLVCVLENRDLHLPITIPLLQAKTLELISAECPDFKASSGWAHKFMQRHSLVLRARTSMAQELPAMLEERIQAFHHQIKRVAEINKFEIVGSIDETPLFFDVVPGRVLDKKGKRSVVVRTTGNQKRHLTVVLTVLADGVVLPALAIFKGKKQPKFHEVGVFIRAQEKAWMDEPMMLEWIDIVWEPATEGRRALLILDSFSAHITPAIKERLKEINTVPVVIPGGCTSKVQPLDVSLNKPFKSYVHHYWSDYILEQPANIQKLKPRMLLGFSCSFL